MVKIAKLKKAYLKYRRHKRELKRKVSDIEVKGEKVYGKYKAKAKSFMDKSGLSELAKVKKHMPTRPKLVKGEKRIAGKLYIRSPYNKNKSR